MFLKIALLEMGAVLKTVLVLANIDLRAELPPYWLIFRALFGSEFPDL